MKINKVTMTGADNSISPKNLFEISQKYPFVEWGLLASRNSQGLNRFPSIAWLAELYKFAPEDLNLSIHLCGAYVREILIGNTSFIVEIGEIWKAFKRVQINTHGIKHHFDKTFFSSVIKNNPDKEFILQFDNTNRDILDSVSHLPNVSTLFDMSHGAGVLPKEWNKPIEGVKCGYAGGLSPENVVSQIFAISKLVGDYELWIDMETHIRSKNDKLFDLDKVVRVLDTCINTGLIK